MRGWELHGAKLLILCRRGRRVNARAWLYVVVRCIIACPTVAAWNKEHDTSTCSVYLYMLFAPALSPLFTSGVGEWQRQSLVLWCSGRAETQW